MPLVAAMLCAWPAGAVSAASDIEWGPMAVLDDPIAAEDLDGALGPGRIRVTEQCVFLDTRGGRKATLAWRSGDSSWDPVTHEVIYEDDRSGKLRLSDGDRVELGGYGGGTMSEPAGGPPMIWLIEPDPACPATIWAVHAVRLLRDAPLVSAPPVESAVPVESVLPVGQGPRGCVEEAYRGPEGAALRADLEDAAISNGWSLVQAEIRYCSSEAVGRIAAVVAREYPGQFVGSVVADDPLAPPSLLLKGVAPPRVHELIARESVRIILVQGQPYSYAELEERKSRVHQALLAMGFAEVSTAIAIDRQGAIPAAVLRTPGLPDNVPAIVAALPADLRDSVELEIYDEPRHVEDAGDPSGPDGPPVPN